jgi:hypothetical protein
MVRVAKDCEAARVIVLAVPVKFTLDPVDTNVVADEVFQFPEIVRDDPPKEMEAPVPEAVRFPMKVTAAEVIVKVEDHVMFEENVVVMPVFTVRLYSVWGMLLDPPEALMMTVEVPTVKVAPAAEVSMLVTVILLLPAVRVPVADTVRLDPPVMLLFEVVSVPVMLKVFDTSIALDWVMVPLTVRL